MIISIAVMPRLQMSAFELYLARHVTLNRVTSKHVPPSHRKRQRGQIHKPRGGGEGGGEESTEKGGAVASAVVRIGRGAILFFPAPA